MGADVMQARCSWPHCPGEPPSAGSLPSEAMRLQDGRGADEGVQLAYFGRSAYWWEKTAAGA